MEMKELDALIEHGGVEEIEVGNRKIKLRKADDIKAMRRLKRKPRRFKTIQTAASRNL